MYTPAQFASTQQEIRKLRIENSGLRRWHSAQKQRSEKLEEKVKEKNQQVERWKKKVKELEEELKKIKQERDTYKGMVFKAKKRLGSAHTTDGTKRPRGGQNGHLGHGRRKPGCVDRIVDVCLTQCPDCHEPLKHANATTTHTVTDVPHWQEMAPITTEYVIERQWCCHCKKEVQGTPAGVIRGSRLGLVIFTMVMVWKYRMRIPLAKIVELLRYQYQLDVSEGAVQALLGRARTLLGSRYEELQREVRGSPVTHADETGWRVGGDTWWCWLFATDRVRMYTIEETRGKGVPEKILAGFEGVLVRDDYGAYQKLSMMQQSCWTHLLRKSHEASTQDGASDEVKYLHQKLKELFVLLNEDLTHPFQATERQELYEWYVKDIERLSTLLYQVADAKRIQTRLKNQGTNLLTALLYPNVPLTNNAAERAIRPMVITRKISGGSKTSNGAETHAVNMSIIETIILQNQPLLDTLHTTLTQAAGKN